MKQTLAAALLAVGLAGPALAQAVPVPPAQVQAGRYAVEPQHTQIEFAISHMGFTTYYGHFSNASGSLQLSPADPAASQLEIAVPVGTVSTTSDKLDEELKSPDWLDATHFPQMTFRSTKIVPSGADAAEVTGDLTLHGVTKPVTLHARFVGAGTNPLDKKYTVGFQIGGEINRSDFGVKTYVPLIGDAVQLTISGAFERQG